MPPRIGAQPAKLQLAPKGTHPLYSSGKWKALVASLKRERGAACSRCGSGDRVIADHIREIRDGGAELDPANIQLLCDRCHQAKTAEARRARARGRT